MKYNSDLLRITHVPAHLRAKLPPEKTNGNRIFKNPTSFKYYFHQYKIQFSYSSQASSSQVNLLFFIHRSTILLSAINDHQNGVSGLLAQFTDNFTGVKVISIT